MRNQRRQRRRLVGRFRSPAAHKVGQLTDPEQRVERATKVPSFVCCPTILNPIGLTSAVLDSATPDAKVIMDSPRNFYGTTFYLNRRIQPIRGEKKRGGRKRCGTGGELHGTAVAEVEVWPDHLCGPGASPKPRDSFFIRQSAYLPEGPSKARCHAKLKTEI